MKQREKTSVTCSDDVRYFNWPTWPIPVFPIRSPFQYMSFHVVWSVPAVVLWQSFIRLHWLIVLRFSDVIARVIFVWCVKQKYRDQEWRSTVRGNPRPRPRGVILGPGNELQIQRWRTKDELVVWLFSEGFSPCLEGLWRCISVLVFKMLICYINGFGSPFFLYRAHVNDLKFVLCLSWFKFANSLHWTWEWRTTEGKGTQNKQRDS